MGPHVFSQDSLFVLGQFGFQVIRTNRNTLGSYILLLKQCGPDSSLRFIITVARAFALLFTEHRYVQFDFKALLYAPSYLLSWDGRQQHSIFHLMHITIKYQNWGHFSVFSMYITYFSKSSNCLLKPNKRKTQTCFYSQPKY